LNSNYEFKKKKEKEKDTYVFSPLILKLAISQGTVVA
jgi:hypothetical protein